MKNKVIIIISIMLISIVIIGIILNITLNNKPDVVDTYNINESATTDKYADNIVSELDYESDFQIDTVHMNGLNENIAKDIYDLGIETFESNNVTLDKIMSTNWDYVETCNAYRAVIYSGKTGIAISYIPGEGFETLSVNSME